MSWERRLLRRLRDGNRVLSWDLVQVERFLFVFHVFQLIFFNVAWFAFWIILDDELGCVRSFDSQNLLVNWWCRSCLLQVVRLRNLHFPTDPGIRTKTFRLLSWVNLPRSMRA